VAEHRAVVGGTYGLPTVVPAGLAPDELVALMGRDKKALDGLTFVLDGPAGVEVVTPVAEAAVRTALASVAP
ncbi:MAG: 3-dehydroquinate synthase, partial [Ilumatobacteraceae bacterium]